VQFSCDQVFADGGYRDAEQTPKLHGDNLGRVLKQLAILSGLDSFSHSVVRAFPSLSLVHDPEVFAESCFLRHHDIRDQCLVDESSQQATGVSLLFVQAHAHVSLWSIQTQRNCWWRTLLLCRSTGTLRI
ncbi:hypothetical protein XENOCAPTIV_013303, partial [Xenoophorus captivus]